MHRRSIHLHLSSIGHSGLVPNGYSCLNCCVICVIFSSISVRLILLTHIALLLHEATGRCLVLLCLHCAVWSPHSCPGPDAKKDCGLDVIWNASIKKNHKLSFLRFDVLILTIEDRFPAILVKVASEQFPSFHVLWHNFGQPVHIHKYGLGSKYTNVRGRNQRLPRDGQTLSVILVSCLLW